MDKVLLFIFDGMTDYEVTLICHLLNRDAGNDKDDFISNIKGL